ncbi:MAG TPA: hypothetical protein ACFYD6_11700 [Candidatus Brocadiia bacterium]|nr:hypothetical protein [Candidatus Brocadiales bacterium]
MDLSVSTKESQVVGHESGVRTQDSRLATRRLIWLTLPTVTDVIFIMLLVTLTIVGSQRMLGDGDPGCHIKTGEYILNHRTLPVEDPFSFTMAGKEWFAWEWLSDVILAWIHGMFGMNGVVVFCNLIVAVTFCFLFKILLSKRVNILIALSLVLVALGASFLHWLARPHIFSWLFTLIAYWMLDEYQLRRKRYIYFLPLVMLVWANLHGGFMIGLILTSIYFLGNFLTFLTSSDKTRSGDCLRISLFLAFIGLISLFASFINPYGLKLIPHIFDTYVSKSLIVDNTNEFMSPNFHDNTVKLYELCVILLIVVLTFSLRRFNFIQIGLVIFWIHMSLFSSRNIPLFLIIITPIIGEYLNDILNQLQGRMDIKAWVKRIVGGFFLISKRLHNLEPGTNSPVYFVIPVAFMVLLCLNGGRIGDKVILNAQFDSKRFPVDAVNFIEANQIPGRMFNEFAWGGYLIYRLYPGQKVFIDGRADMYGEPFVKDYLEVIRAGTNWASVLEKNDINWATIPTSSPIAAVLRADNRWKHIYKDDTATIFIRNSS